MKAKTTNDVDSSIHKASKNTLFNYYEAFIKVNNLANNIGVIDSNTGCSYNHGNVIADSDIFAKYICNTISLKTQSTGISHQSSLIAILSEKGYNQIVAALAIMKAGYPYLPLNIAWPVTRLEEILTQGDVKILLISKEQSLLPYIKEKLSLKYTFLIIEEILSQVYISSYSVKQLELVQLPIVNPNDTAYVIFTSGSTGIPKGVSVSHCSVLNTILAVNYKYMVNHTDSILALSELSFDLSVYDIFGLLLVGGIVIFPQQKRIKNPSHWVELINKYNITLWNTVPQLAELLIDELQSDKLKITSLRLFLLSGDKIPINLPDRIKSYCDKTHIISLGGATECSIWSIWYEIKDEISNQSTIPYGIPMPNQMVYILNDSLEISPIGEIGEIFIGGAGLAINYYRDKEKTNLCFIMHNQLGRIYKTGDLGRWHKSGYVEFIGRKDSQVKIFGNRIELGEIENKLCMHPEIKQAIVTFTNQLDSSDASTKPKSLVAYYVKDSKYLNDELDNYIKNWIDVYDDMYKQLSLDNSNYNTCGWNSSYTLEPIPKTEIKDFIDNTIARIAGLNPKNVLEIGSGAGLILFNLIDKCDTYIANDFSALTIEYLNQMIDKQKLENKVHTICCNAHEIYDIVFEYSIDTVIINSVVQYFPNLDYLINLLQIIISKINTKGTIFIGDVRDYRLLKLFHFSVLSYQKVPLSRELIDEYSLRDTELLIIPEFFIYCKTIFDRIKHVEILPKNGLYNNEMNCFRYDVVLHIDDAKSLEKTAIIHTIYSNDVASVLQNTNSNEIFLSYINKRIYKEYSEFNKFVGTRIESSPNVLLGIDELYQLATKYNYNLKILLDAEDSLFLNLIFYKDPNNKYYSDNITTIHISNLTEMANNPVQNTSLSDNAMAESLEKYLLTQLPEYMVPKYYIKLAQIPLTLNGKINYAALPAIKFVNNRTYVAPRNDLESKLVTIWSDVLGISKDQISIEDSFFKLGGNSLLIVQLRRKLIMLDEFKKIELVDLFSHTTIQELMNLATTTPNSTTTIKLTTSSNYRELDVAIIALSGAFSGGENIEDFWNLINSGKSGLKKHTLDECADVNIAEEILNHPNFVPVTGKIADTNKFDSTFWKMTPDEAHELDPQIRKFLEHCWYVLEDSGYISSRTNLNIGVFAGGRNSPHSNNEHSQYAGQGILGAWGGAGVLSTHSSLAMQVSYLLGLTGVANNINTACSTSLIAIIEACKSLVGGYCEMALAGGVSLLLPEEMGYMYQENGIFAKNGQSRIFDSESSGMVSGSGVGVVLLKPLAMAKRDNDNIIAVIKGYAANNDGKRKMSYTAPSVIGQTECIVNAQKMAGVFSNEINFVECHGTGTQLGDAIEIQALTNAFKYNNDLDKEPSKCLIGSVKANIGHTELAAGVAGVIKVCKMLEHKTIPMQANFDVPSTNIDFNHTPFIIPTKKIPWLSRNTNPRIAGISSFGIGGTNAHIIISDYLPDESAERAAFPHFDMRNLPESPKNTTNYILPISAKSETSLLAYAEDFMTYLEETTDDLSDIAYTLQLKRENFAYRASVVANSYCDALEKFAAVKAITNVVIRNEPQDIVFMFPGQGAQHANMTLDLYEYDDVYRSIVNSCLLIINRHTGVEFKRILFPQLFGIKDNIDEINQTKWAQVALFSVSYALAKRLEILNIKASAYMGHSIGELVAATLSGVFELNDAIKLVLARGKLMQEMPQSSMLHIQTNADEVAKLIQESQCEIAVINSPQQCVISGMKENVLKVKFQLDKINVPSTFLNVSHGYHSYIMSNASKQFADEFKGIKLYPPKLQFISNVTGQFIDPKEAVDPKYWSKHIRQKVLFAEGVKTLSKHLENPFFIQVGPGKELLTFVRQSYMTKINGVAMFNKWHHSMKNSKEDILNKLWVHGCKLNFHLYLNNWKLYKTVHLPRYHFANEEYEFKIRDRIFKNNVNKNLKVIQTVPHNNIAERVLETGLSEQDYAIAKMFLQLLKIDKLSIHDGFFELGGNSIAAVSLVAQLKKLA